MKKNNKLHIGVSTETKEKLKKQAEELELSLTEYCRLVLVSAKPKTTPFDT